MYTGGWVKTSFVHISASRHRRTTFFMSKIGFLGMANLMVRLKTRFKTILTSLGIYNGIFGTMPISNILYFFKLLMITYIIGYRSVLKHYCNYTIFIILTVKLQVNITNYGMPERIMGTVHHKR